MVFESVFFCLGSPEKDLLCEVISKQFRSQQNTKLSLKTKKDFSGNSLPALKMTNKGHQVENKSPLEMPNSSNCKCQIQDSCKRQFKFTAKCRIPVYCKCQFKFTASAKFKFLSISKKSGGNKVQFNSYLIFVCVMELY